jgi:sugar/nucleoside kinase (ribokinase family)
LVAKCLRFVNSSCPGMRMMVSLGERGTMGFWNGHWNFCPAPAVRVASTAGAGDALLAGVISGLAAGIPFLRSRSGKNTDGEPLQSALELGAMLASFSVTSPHTIHPSADLDTLATFVRACGKRINTSVEELFMETYAHQRS